ncbi:MAG: phenylalanine--tRNA ligase subunit alpha, partial [Chloroflexi bacterium]|nr:phenylalanine--tRNA ligase subunit alpha [Chloroflexota bacterium]
MTQPTSQSSALSVQDLVDTAAGELAGINDTESLEAWRVAYLGRRGRLTLFLRGLAQLD